MRPQRLKPNSLQSIYVRAEGRTLQEKVCTGLESNASGAFSGCGKTLVLEGGSANCPSNGPSLKKQ